METPPDAAHSTADSSPRLTPRIRPVQLVIPPLYWASANNPVVRVFPARSE